MQKEQLVLRKEVEVLNSQLETAKTVHDNTIARADLLEKEVKDLRTEVAKNQRPITVNAAAQTDNRREEELMDLMKTFDPKVLKEAFDAELTLEKEKNAWISGQLHTTRQMLYTLANHVNETSFLDTSSARLPRFMRSTKSATNKLRPNGPRKSNNIRNKQRYNRKTRQNIHRILKAANFVSLTHC